MVLKASRGLALAVALSFLLSLAAARPSGARTKTTITCASPQSWQWLIPRWRPWRCMVFVHNRPDHADQIDLHAIRWSGWGNGLAKGRAITVYVGMGRTEKHKARLAAFRLRNGWCGTRAYTRLTVRIPAMHWVGTLHQPTCKTALY